MSATRIEPGRTIGFDRRIRFAWLEATAQAVTRAASPAEIRAALEDVLAPDVAGSGVHHARGKTKTILLHVWVLVPENLRQLRDDALCLLTDGSDNDRLALHWGMLLATYPFFRDVATQLGRLLEIQGTVSLHQLQRRVAESWGERVTIQRAVPPVVKSIAEWGVLAGTARPHRYQSAARGGELSHQVQSWLVEALYLARGDRSIALRDLLKSPALFPFELGLSTSAIYRHPRLEVMHLGLDQDIVTRRASATILKSVS